MKKANNLLLLAVATLLLGSASQTNGQYRAVGDDGIAASPKFREMLNKRKAAAGTPTSDSRTASVSYKVLGDDGIAASPKFRQMLNERKSLVSTRSTESRIVSVSYQALGDDGIAASP